MRIQEGLTQALILVQRTLLLSVQVEMTLRYEGK